MRSDGAVLFFITLNYASSSDKGSNRFRMPRERCADPHTTVFGFYNGSQQYPIQREYYSPTYSFGFAEPEARKEEVCSSNDTPLEPLTH